MMMIGLCFGTTDGTILLQRAFCWKRSAYAFDTETYDEFWCKHPAVLDRIEAEASSDTPLLDFVTCMRDLEAKYGPFGRKHEAAVKVKIGGDALGFDWGHISIEMYKAGFMRHAQEMFSDYVPSFDPTDQMRGMTVAEKARVMTDVTAPHDHWAVSDATRIFQIACGVAKVMAARSI